MNLKKIIVLEMFRKGNLREGIFSSHLAVEFGRIITSA